MRKIQVHFLVILVLAWEEWASYSAHYSASFEFSFLCAITVLKMCLLDNSIQKKKTSGKKSLTGNSVAATPQKALAALLPVQIINNIFHTKTIAMLGNDVRIMDT